MSILKMLSISIKNREILKMLSTLKIIRIHKMLSILKMLSCERLILQVNSTNKHHSQHLLISI